MTTSSWQLVEMDQDDALANVFLAVRPFAASLGLIVRSPSVRLHQQAIQTLDSLNPYLVEVSEMSEWPGTKLLGDRKSTRYLYEFGESVSDVILSASADISAWVNPRLPEDLHLLRKDRSTILSTIAQDDVGWIDLRQSEVDHVIPLIGSHLRHFE